MVIIYPINNIINGLILSDQINDALIFYALADHQINIGFNPRLNELTNYFNDNSEMIASKDDIEASLNRLIDKDFINTTEDDGKTSNRPGTRYSIKDFNSC